LICCVLDILAPKPPTAETDLPNQSARSRSALYSYAPELLCKSASETPHQSTSSLLEEDSGCFRSPADEIPSLCIVDDFDNLIHQLKCIGNLDLVRSGSPYLRDHRTVPYFPPVTSALRRECGLFGDPQTSCVDYGDDDALPSPQYLPTSSSSLSREFAVSLLDVNSTSVTDLQTFPPLSESLLMQVCSHSCPDVCSPYTAANIQQATSTNDVRFRG